MNDYERIACVIRYLDECHTEQPDLALLAQRAGLSQFHFHRLFSKWAGITPKDFLQCLTLAHARELLRKGESVLDAALEAGLSGPGRLHELCVSLEAASPGELKSGGEGWTLAAGFADTPFGTCLVGQSPRGLCHFSFVEAGGEPAALAALQADWPRARLQRDDRTVQRLARSIFQPNRGPGVSPASLGQDAQATDKRPLRAFVCGTAFQVRVWRALLRIPAGTLVSYGRLAAALGQPAAARAVGAAVGQNPVAYLIPCHRVIRETGALGGYGYGLVRKGAMLAWENAARTARSASGAGAFRLAGAFGKTAAARAETRRIQKLIEEEFEKIEPEDRQ